VNVKLTVEIEGEIPHYFRNNPFIIEIRIELLSNVILLAKMRKIGQGYCP